MSVGTQAFYILFAENVLSPQWPQKLCQNNGRGAQGTECVDARKYQNGVFIASPQNFTTDLIAKVKKDVPGSSVVAYWDFGDIPLATTYKCGPSPFLSALQSTFPPRLAVHDITNGTPGECVESYPGLAKYVWNSKSAPLLADFLGGWLLDHGFDGLYLDGYVQPNLEDFHECKTKEQGCRSFIEPGHVYDIDGDGVADEPDAIYGSFFGWAPAFVASMRQKLGPSAIILANSGGSISDSSLNGVTIEMEACVAARGGSRRCEDALAAQKLASATIPGVVPTSVLWLTHSETMPAKQQCETVAKLQVKYPWVQAGTDYFDGSHVSC